MRVTFPSAIVVGVALAAGTAASAQGTGSMGAVPREEAIALKVLVDRVLAGDPAGGDAWLKWSGHFMRAADGRVYVPFTLRLDDVTAEFAPVAIYVRVAPRGASSKPLDVKVRDAQLGTAVSAPERNFARGNPTAGEASAQMGLIASELSAVPMPFEGVYVSGALTGQAPEIRRSLVVAPGEYDLYVAVRERPRSGGPSRLKSAVLQTNLTVPDLSGDTLTVSSLILADRITALGKRLSASQQAERPYAINSTEVFPRTGGTFERGDVLSVVFFAYNLAVDEKKLPDATVQYRFRQMSTGAVFGEMAPQHFSRDHTPPEFDSHAGRQLAVTQALPLATFPPDTYELEVLMVDNLSGRAASQSARFTVGTGRQ